MVSKIGEWFVKSIARYMLHTESGLAWYQTKNSLCCVQEPKAVLNLVHSWIIILSGQTKCCIIYKVLSRQSLSYTPILDCVHFVNPRCVLFYQIRGHNGTYQLQIVCNDFPNLAPVYVRVDIRACVLGEVTNVERDLCTMCPQRSFSFNPMNITCDKCPVNANCSYGHLGNIFIPDRGYWHSHPHFPQVCCHKPAQVLPNAWSENG